MRRYKDQGAKKRSSAWRDEKMEGLEGRRDKEDGGMEKMLVWEGWR